MKLITWLLAILDKANRVLINLGVVALFAMMIIDTLSIIGLQFGIRAIPGDKTIIEELMTLVIFIGIAYVLFERGHIKTEILKSRFTPPLRFASNVLAYLVMACVCIFIAWTNGAGAIEFLRLNVTSPADLPIPMGPFLLLIAIAFADLALCTVLLLIKECLSRGAVRVSSEKGTP